MAKVAYELFTKMRIYPNWSDYARRLGADINWRKTAPIWQDNIISGGKSFSNKGPLNKAFEAVKAEIGMTPASSTEGLVRADQSLGLESGIGA